MCWTLSPSGKYGTVLCNWGVPFRWFKQSSGLVSYLWLSHSIVRWEVCKNRMLRMFSVPPACYRSFDQSFPHLILDSESLTLVLSADRQQSNGVGMVAWYILQNTFSLQQNWVLEMAEKFTVRKWIHFWKYSSTC